MQEDTTRFKTAVGDIPESTRLAGGPAAGPGPPLRRPGSAGHAGSDARQIPARRTARNAASVPALPGFGALAALACQYSSSAGSVHRPVSGLYGRLQTIQPSFSCHPAASTDFTGAGTRSSPRLLSGA